MKTFLIKSRSRIFQIIPIFLILLLSVFLRLYGLDWDQGQHLHPDERFLTMVASAIKIPDSFPTYLNPQTSPMNPYNTGYGFFVYGTFPVYLTKIIGVLTGSNSYSNIHFVGRILSALFDVGTVYLVYLISRRIFSNHPNLPNFPNLPLLAAFLYSIMVLPIQLSHFFAVDTFLNFFIVLSFYFLVLLISSCPSSPSKKLLTLNFELLTGGAVGAAFGLALACKISALYFLPVIGLGYFFLFLKNLKSLKHLKLLKLSASGITFVFFTFLFFRLAQPSAFSSGSFLNWQPNPQFIKNLKELKSMSGSDSWYPPAIQWHSAKPIIFPLKNLVLWGMGLPLGIISIISIGYTVMSLYRYIVKKSLNTEYLILNTLVVLWVLGLFLYQGLQFCKTMRYFLPIYPFLAILAANFLSKLNIKLIIFIIIIIFIYPLSFLSIYSCPITRVTASEWIYKNIPAGSTITYEEWDDGLPLSLPDFPYRPYQTESLFMYDFDTPEKWQKLQEKLAKIDYIFITSNRAYGSTMKLPEKYPQTTTFYQSLFNETGDFKKAAEFTSYPCFPPFGNKHLFCFSDGSSEEAFTVYDHPKVMIFKRN